jgi:hypothetical protein
MRFLLFLLLTALPLLGACTPAAETVSYTLPSTPGGRMCSHQCSEAQDYCLQSCDIKQRTCVMEVQTRAMNDYDKYTRDQYSRHEAIELNPSDFERQGPCTGIRATCAAACDKHFQSCYQECGGEVNITSSCQFLCF